MDRRNNLQRINFDTATFTDKSLVKQDPYKYIYLYQGKNTISAPFPSAEQMKQEPIQYAYQPVSNLTPSMITNARPKASNIAFTVPTLEKMSTVFVNRP